MGNKIFISYKYRDQTVYGNRKTVRDYVDELQGLLEKENHVNKGEPDDEDLSSLADDTIRQKLADRMYDSTVTIVMISPNMKESGKSERNQWIPWEVSYSLRIQDREKGGKSYPNAVLAVTLPDAYGSYEYYIQKKSCSSCGNYRTLMTRQLFPILHGNMFNLKKPSILDCSNHTSLHTGECCYVISATWDEFVAKLDDYIERANSIRDNIDNYKMVKELEK